MKRKIGFLAVLALAALICLPGMAMADYTLVGQYGFYDTYPESGVGAAINRIEAYITSGSVTFGAPGFIPAGYGVGFDSFISSLITPTHASMATASPQTAVSFDYRFTGAPFVPFTIDWNAFSGNDFKLHEHIEVFGAGNATGVYNQAQYNPVPIPPSALLLGSGLLGIVGLGWRRRGAKSAAA